MSPDDLIYELTNRGELPCLQFGRRKVIPQQAIDSVIELALVGFDPGVLLVTLETRINHSPLGSATTWTSAPPAQ